MTQITHTINHINKLSSKNNMKLRIHNCDNGFQIGFQVHQLMWFANVILTN